MLLHHGKSSITVFHHKREALVHQFSPSSPVLVLGARAEALPLDDRFPIWPNWPKADPGRAQLFLGLILGAELRNWGLNWE
jgi:hypothetical protein